MSKPTFLFYSSAALACQGDPFHHSCVLRVCPCHTVTLWAESTCMTCSLCSLLSEVALHVVECSDL